MLDNLYEGYMDKIRLAYYNKLSATIKIEEGVEYQVKNDYGVVTFSTAKRRANNYIFNGDMVYSWEYVTPPTATVSLPNNDTKYRSDSSHAMREIYLNIREMLSGKYMDPFTTGTASDEIIDLSKGILKDILRLRKLLENTF